MQNFNNTIITGTFNYDDFNNMPSVGTVTKSVTFTPATTNYDIIVFNTNITINVKQLTITGATVDNKTYDGNVNATISNYGTLNGIVTGDDVTLNISSVSATFNNPTIGNNKQVIFDGYTIVGISINNYNLVQPTTFANIDNSIVPCYSKGTKILCLINNDYKYVPIEDLKSGDIVKTYLHGDKEIIYVGQGKFKNNTNNFTECMYKMKKSSNSSLIEDLIVTGYHSVLVDDLGKYKDINNKLFNKEPKLDDKYLLLASVSEDFIKMMDKNEYIYYHICLENEDDNKHYGIWTNGILSETISKKLFMLKPWLNIY